MHLYMCLVTQSCQTLWPCGLQSTRLLCSWIFSRQEYWSGLPSLSTGDLTNPGMEPRSLALQVDFFTMWATREPLRHCVTNTYNYIYTCVCVKYIYMCIYITPCIYSSLENHMNSMKRQKDTTLKDELHRSIGAQNATGDQWRNNSRKNEEMQPKQRQHPVVDQTDGKREYRPFRNQQTKMDWNVWI